MAKILISAGEASGDIHAAAVTAAIKKLDSKAEVFGMGGDALRQAGGEVLWDIKDHGVMGFVEVIRKLPIYSACAVILRALWTNASRTVW